jgi:hypothetical protein
MKTVFCKYCKKEFLTYPSFILNGRGKFCSRQCKGKYHPVWNKGKKTGQIVWNKGIKRTDIIGNKNGNWLGDKVGYQGLHIRINKMLGNPSKCEICGTKTAKKFEWANKSHVYKIEKTDWIRMCKSCHVIYDRTYCWGASKLYYAK